MIVYFVRHGESEGNAANVHQTSKTPLSDIGIDQARLVGYRFKKIPINAIIASDYLRTVQTATIINGYTHKPLETSALLREFTRPSEILGKQINDPLVLAIKQQIAGHQTDPEWHYSDEENFYDFRFRVKQCLDMLKKRTERKILVVTHGFILCMTMSYIVFGDELTPSIFEKMYHQFHNSNTGITTCEYRDDLWQLKTWNDVAHLGE